ncbi:AI-2E family transporter [Luteithermobacter gelatinilyticus]|uniref:AI-2E family transporter n=1 Tax=Luteithermobacter gelatinilyticus TaxID=2582913 RepID=UPI00143D4BBA|nr:AI-2E family transporter [Luteithermobacter gelatinilyticus]
MRILTFAGGLGLITLIVFIMVIGRDLLVPFMIAVVIWYLIHTLSDYFQKIRLAGRSLPPKLSFALALLTMMMALVLLFDMISNNITDVKTAAPHYQENFRSLTGRFFALIGLDDQVNLNQFLSQISLAPFITNIASTMAALAGNASLILIYLLFLILEEKFFPQKLDALLKNSRYDETVRTILTHVAQDIEKYVAIKTFVSLLTGLACYVVLILVGVDYAEFWAFIIFLLNYIPTIGSLLAVIFPALLSLVQFDTFTPFVVVLVTLGTIQFSVGNILEPKLMGNSLNLSPLVVMLSLALWGSIWGIAGMFLSVPFTVILMIVFSQFPATRPVAILLSQDGYIKARKVVKNSGSPQQEEAAGV